MIGEKHNFVGKLIVPAVFAQVFYDKMKTYFWKFKKI